MAEGPTISGEVGSAGEITPLEVQPAIFTPQPAFTPCSWHECLQGHRWPITVALAKCSGCQGAMLAIRQENCPFCNEPAKSMVIRTDIVPPGSGAVPRCKGAKVFGESLDQIIERKGYQDGAASFKPFLVKQAEEETKRGKISGTSSSSNLE